MRAIKIATAEIQNIKQFLRTKTHSPAMSRKEKSFIRYCSKLFFLGGSILYRKTSDGAEKVLGPISCDKFKDCTLGMPFKHAKTYTTPLDSPFYNW
ncbi:hypothetical protein NEMIN01_1862 [Nematocida minor]|uniref:uncharacterized protein n=1 Tax=Nematocida minor TaxID=1912983 RepID=UPI00221FF243|nr:uncharacterized protein NEMIN01_1862 [Nematocida minor]KAI5192193.1 hypothetical protein NEMIN01_1862 [Nematocida minor]